METCNIAAKAIFVYVFEDGDQQHLTWTHSCPSNCNCTHFSISLYDCISKQWSAHNFSTEVNGMTLTSFVGIAKIEICSHTKCYKSPDSNYCTDGNAIYTTSIAGNCIYNYFELINLTFLISTN